MKGRIGYFVIAALLLTILDAVVTVNYGMAIWKAWSGDIWCRGPGVLLAGLGASSLVNVWVQAVLRSGASCGSRGVLCGRNATPIPAEARRDGDV